MTIWAFRKPGPDVYPQGYVMFDGAKPDIRIEFRQSPEAPYQVMNLDRRSARLLARRLEAALNSKSRRVAS